MRARRVIGAALVALPFIGVAVVGCLYAGYGSVVFAFGMTFAIVAVVSLGLHLCSPGEKDSRAPMSAKSYTVDELVTLARQDNDLLPWAFTANCHMCGGVGAFLNWLRQQDSIKEGCEK